MQFRFGQNLRIYCCTHFFTSNHAGVKVVTFIMYGLNQAVHNPILHLKVLGPSWTTGGRTGGQPGRCRMYQSSNGNEKNPNYY